MKYTKFLYEILIELLVKPKNLNTISTKSLTRFLKFLKKLMKLRKIPQKQLTTMKKE